MIAVQPMGAGREKEREEEGGRETRRGKERGRKREREEGNKRFSRLPV